MVVNGFALERAVEGKGESQITTSTLGHAPGLEDILTWSACVLYLRACPASHAVVFVPAVTVAISHFVANLCTLHFCGWNRIYAFDMRRFLLGFCKETLLSQCFDPQLLRYLCHVRV